MSEQSRAAQSLDGPQGSNRVAVAGAVASIIPPIGLCLSIAGLVRSKTAGAGRTTAAVGLVLSLVFGVGYGFAISHAGGAGGSDPACATAQTTLNSIQNPQA